VARTRKEIAAKPQPELASQYDCFTSGHQNVSGSKAAG
jgi:hypothetical protein